MKNILFVQLPLNDHGNNYVAGNTPYASAVLSAYINLRLGDMAKAEYIPVEFCNYASNELLSRYIIRKNPDILGFVCYLWNIERNIEIARILQKDSSFSSKIIFGGAEITEDSIFLNIEGINYFSGEGEWFFYNYLKGRIDLDNIHYIKQPPDEQTDVLDIVEPFVNNYLNSSFDNSVFIEMTRGCPYKCVYCSYSKNLKKVRELAPDILSKAIEKAQKRGIREIYILSPTFDRAPHFKSTLRELSDINNLQLHTELRTDKIDRETAEQLRLAGFASLEVGIQTLTSSALEKSGRKDRIEKEIEGIHNLKDNGIFLKIGIIPGLPGDSPQSFNEGLNRLCEEGLESEIELYPLMVLPGTVIRSKASEYAINYMEKPPYYQLSNSSFTEEDIQTAKSIIEKKSGLYTVSDLRPDFFHEELSSLCKGIFLSTDDADWEESFDTVPQDSYVFSYFVQTEDIARLIPPLMRLVPINKLYNIVILSETVFDDDALIAYLGKIEEDCFYRRVHHFEDWLRGTRVMFHQVVKNKTSYMEIYERNTVIEPLYYTDSESNTVTNADPMAIILPTKANDADIEDVSERYAEYPEMIRFFRYGQYKDFTDKAGIQNIKPNPYFSIRNYNGLLRYFENNDNK